MESCSSQILLEVRKWWATGAGLSASNCVQQGAVLRWFVGRSGKLMDANATNIWHYHWNILEIQLKHPRRRWILDAVHTLHKGSSIFKLRGARFPYVSIICINHRNDWFAIRHRFKVGIFMPYWIQEMEVAEHVSPDCTFHLIQDLLNLGTTSNSLNMKLDIFIIGQAEEIRCDVLDVFVSVRDQWWGACFFLIIFPSCFTCSRQSSSESIVFILGFVSTISGIQT